MKYLTNTAMVIAALLTLSACETVEMKDESASKATEETTMSGAVASSLISEAKTTLDQVVELGNAWRDTEEVIKEAEKAVNLNDYAKAESLAREAIEQNRLATIQHEQQKNTGPLF